MDAFYDGDKYCTLYHLICCVMSGRTRYYQVGTPLGKCDFDKTQLLNMLHSGELKRQHVYTVRRVRYHILPLPIDVEIDPQRVTGELHESYEEMEQWARKRFDPDYVAPRPTPETAPAPETAKTRDEVPKAVM